ncbi:hypothetical protein B0T21DRAFT_106683 [Apiosordaria backusii]|uniref:Uncharacterized protein n=1 Tax=Apiosordaria backusii TaxID=314023 RepID=A0AA40DKF8_9PEZI|nr:hypothetical protein B0T21DRAFT_106683 [Apiosordaria backusii]
METSAPKRRRTSPRTAVQIQLEQESTTPPETSAQLGGSPRRPSYASPTRASLERHNPEILRRRESQPSQSQDQSQSQLSPNAPLPTETPDSTGGLTRALRTQLDLRSAKRNGDSAAGDGQNDGAKAGEEDKGLRSPARRLSAKRATGIPRPIPRPLPPPAPEEAVEAINPFARRGLRRSPPMGVLPEVVVPEPELPPTPERPDPVVSTPPSGIHNTPSRRPKRSKALAERIKSSSPLKQPPMRPPEPGQLHGSTQESSFPSKKGQQVSPAAPQEPTTAELRGLKPIDPETDKKKLRDSLLAELASLEQDLNVGTTENERIRQARLSKKEASPPPNPTEIISLLRRHALPPEKEALPDPTDDWLASALNPISFLPFSKPLPTAPQPVPDNLDKPIISHHPMAMTAAESLPFLRAFTPLTFTSQIFPLPKQEDKPLLQQHFITASSATPSKGLFTARIEMTVNTKTLAVQQIQVPKMDPPAAAAELSPFINKIINKPNDGSVPSSGLYNNISVLTWAMGEWLRVGVERAKVWRVLEEEINDKAKLVEMVRKSRERKKQNRGRKRRNDDHDEEGEDEEEQDRDEAGKEGKKLDDAGDLLPYMGKTCLDLEIPVLNDKRGEEKMTSGLRVTWKIEFDWTGEARSDLGVLVGMPGKWHKHDERGQLSGIPRLFDELIRGGEEPLSAVRTVVSLLAGEQRS